MVVFTKKVPVQGTDIQQLPGKTLIQVPGTVAGIKYHVPAKISKRRNDR